ncbi:MFS transporter [Paludibacterium paludis]|uniref:MFS transporter n=1 Tax=Paludibacterium paludis TaxID=1225769 RepID=A0A918P4R4_9NEIS|nr:MFS transporter [Paludibacterium paludis]GGY20334.1 MFS transporter [Paludibacterium paludis]
MKSARSPLFRTPTDNAPSFRQALAGLSLSVLLSSLGNSIANVALPELTRVFGIAFQQAQWIVLAYLLSSTALLVAAGRLGDQIGRRRMLCAGLALFCAASSLGCIPFFPLVLAARTLQGLAAAFILPLAMAFAAGIAPRERLGRATGWMGSMSAVGTALGPSLGGMLIATFGWRAMFLVNVPIGIAALWLTYRNLPPDTPAPPVVPARFDSAGTLTLTVSLTTCALALTTGRGEFGAIQALLLFASIAVAGLFFRIERRAGAPLIPPILLRDPALRAGLATTFLVSAVMMATLVVGPFYLSRALNLGTASIGMVMSVGPVVAALCGAPAGHAVDRFGARGMTIGGLSGLLGGVIALAALPSGLGIGGYIVPVVIATSGYALFQAANTARIMADAPPDGRGAISGLINLSRNLGLVTGASVLGRVFAIASGPAGVLEAPRASVATGMHVTFAVASLLMLIAVLIAGKNR